MNRDNSKILDYSQKVLDSIAIKELDQSEKDCVARETLAGFRDNQRRHRTHRTNSDHQHRRVGSGAVDSGKGA